MSTGRHVLTPGGSLRTLASGIGTSQRMLNYHFGSREGLLGAVVEAVERAEQEQLLELVGTRADPFEAGAVDGDRARRDRRSRPPSGSA